MLVTSTQYLEANRVIAKIPGWCHRLLSPVPYKAQFLLRELGFWSPVKNRDWAQIPFCCLFLHVICFYFLKRKILAMGYRHFKSQHQLSPNTINNNVIEKHYKNKSTDHLRENSLTFDQVLSTYSLRKCMEISQ